MLRVGLGWIWILSRSRKLFQSPGIYCPLAYVRTHLVSFGPLTEAHSCQKQGTDRGSSRQCPGRFNQYEKSFFELSQLKHGFVSLSVFYL